MVTARSMARAGGDVVENRPLIRTLVSMTIRSMRGVDDVRVDVERRLDARVPELLLRDLHRHAQIVEQRRMNVAELMPRHASEPCAFRRRL